MKTADIRLFSKKKVNPSDILIFHSNFRFKISSAWGKVLLLHKQSDETILFKKY
jgi:hypothetical protein